MDSATRPKGSVTLPHLGPVTDALARNIRKRGVQVHIRPTNTIRSRLVHPKDKLDKLDQAGVVYKIECKECDDTYVGESARQLKDRFNEHHRSSSPVGQHLKERRHSIDNDSIAVIHREEGWFKRGVAESIHVRRERPTLNLGRERHTLPPIYNELMSQSHH